MQKRSVLVKKSYQFVLVIADHLGELIIILFSNGGGGGGGGFGRSGGGFGGGGGGFGGGGRTGNRTGKKS